MPRSVDAHEPEPAVVAGRAEQRDQPLLARLGDGEQGVHQRPSRCRAPGRPGGTPSGPSPSTGVPSGSSQPAGGDARGRRRRPPSTATSDRCGRKPASSRSSSTSARLGDVVGGRTAPVTGSAANAARCSAWTASWSAGCSRRTITRVADDGGVGEPVVQAAAVGVDQQRRHEQAAAAPSGRRPARAPAAAPAAGAPGAARAAACPASARRRRRRDHGDRGEGEPAPSCPAGRGAVNRPATSAEPSASTRKATDARRRSSPATRDRRRATPERRRGRAAERVVARP